MTAGCARANSILRLTTCLQTLRFRPKEQEPEWPNLPPPLRSLNG